MTTPIKFINGELEKQWDEGEGHGVKLHPKLIELVNDFCAYAYVTHGWIPEVTSIVRTKEEDAELGGTSIHTTGRALDIRTRGIPDAIVSDCKAYIDRGWQYDKMRPKMSACYTAKHGTGPHAHMQVTATTAKTRIGA